MAPRETPEAWARLLEQAGIASPHALAMKTGNSTATISRLVHGKGRPDVNTVRAVADALTGGDTDAIWRLTETGLRDRGEWRPPASASLLDDRQRRALDELIQSMTQPKQRGGDGDDEVAGRSAAPIDDRAREEMFDDQMEQLEERAVREGRPVEELIGEVRREAARERRARRQGHDRVERSDSKDT